MLWVGGGHDLTQILGFLLWLCSYLSILSLSLSFLLGKRNHAIYQTLELKAEQAGVRQLSLG